jgi:predicted HTH transcriptional regulator
MALLDIPLDRITEADLQRLIAAGVSESLYIDYKKYSYGNSESDHAEFLADVSSFANIAGGDVLIGMAETKGVPTRIIAFMGDPDAERRRLEDIARMGLEPRVRNLRTLAVPVRTGGHVIIVRVPRSYMPPHRVNYRNRNRFWARASLGKYEPNVEELRHLFNDAPHLAERIRSFRTDRLIRINAGEREGSFTRSAVASLR